MEPVALHLIFMILDKIDLLKFNLIFKIFDLIILS